MFTLTVNSFCVLILVASQLGDCFTIFNTREILETMSKRKEIPLSLAFNHKQTQDFVKRLEYSANSNAVPDASIDFGLVPIDLNYFNDETFAYDIEEGVEEELEIIDKELGEINVASDAENTEIKNMMNASLMHTGTFHPAPEYNSLIDGHIFNVQRDFRRRFMDPLYFNIHDKGVIRHITNRTKEERTTPTPKDENRETAALGGGDIKGLLQLKRFGNAESRIDGHVTLVRSHYFFGPLDIDLVFQSNRGLRTVNSTLSALAAHALFEISNINNATTLKEFITDSPMEYEIQLKGTRNKRFRRLSQTAIMRLFRRDGRLELRILRSFRRAAQRPIRDETKRRRQQERRKEKFRNGSVARPRDQNPKI